MEGGAARLMINLEIPKKFEPSSTRPTRWRSRSSARSRASTTSPSTTYPKELDMLAAVIDGMDEGGALGGAGAGAVGGGRQRRLAERLRRLGQPQRLEHGQPARAHRAVLGRRRPAADDARPGLGRPAIAAVANEEQLKRFGGKWAAMAITEPEAGSDSAAIRTTAKLDGRRVRAQRREDLRHLRRARRAGRGVGDARPRAGPRRDQVVRGRARQPRA